MVSPTPPAHPSQTAFKRWFPFFALGAIWRSRPETRRHAPIRWQHMESLELRQLMAGTPAQLAFIVQPSQVAALSAVSPSIQVAVEDSTGITVTTDNSTIVSLTLTQNPIGGGFTNTSTISMKVTGGVANFTNVAFTTAGLYSISASSGTLAIPTSNIFTVTQPASKLAFLQAPVNLSAGQLFPNAVSVAIQDATGNVVTTDRSNITLTVVSGPGGGTINGTTTVQAINGIATFNGISLPKAGAYTIQARDGSLTVVNSASFTVSPGAPSQLAFAQPPVSAAGSAVLTPSPVVNILDALGNIVTSDSSTVTLSILTGPPGGSIAGSATAVASNGVATFSNISFPTFGVYTLQASDGSLHTVNSNSFAITGPAAQLIFQVQPKQITVGHTSSNNITVLVADAGGNLVTNDTSSVTISVASGPLGGSINGTTTVSAVNGVATFTGLNFSVPGTYTLDISDGVLTNATSNSFIVNGLADHLIFAQQPGPSAAKSPIPGGVTVSIVDTDGNVVIDDFSPVTIAMNETTALLTGTTAVAAFNGIASFTNLIPSSAGTYTLVASASGVADAVSDPFSVSPPPSKLVITQGPVNVAATSTMPPIVVKVENPDGSVATTDTSKITLAIVSGPANATLSGTTAVNAVAGVATFSNLKFSTPGTYQLVAFDGSLATDTSVTFVVSGPPSKLVIIQQPLASVTAGNTASGMIVQVAVRDANNTLITTDHSIVTLAITTGPTGGTIVGNATAQAVNGIATFANLSFNTAGTSYILTASDSTLAKAATSSFKVLPDTSSAHLHFVSAPASILPGVKIPTSIVLDVVDKFNNIITTDSSTVLLTKVSGAGTVTGTLSVKAVKGIVSFANVKFSEADTYQLLATDAKFSKPSTVTNNTTSFAITVSPAVTVIKAPKVSSSYAINKAVSFSDTITSLVKIPGAFTGQVHVVQVVGTNNTEIASATISSTGAVKFTNIVDTSTAGTQALRIVYDGDANHTGGQSPIFNVVVAPASSLTILHASSTAITTADTLHLSATVNSATASVLLARTGSVVIKDNGLPVAGGTLSLTSNAATLDLSALTAGTHKFTATYLGDDNFKTSTSSLLTVKVTV